MLKRIEDYNKVLPIVEVYRCVQSEGSRFGRPTIAVRTTGCTHRCCLVRVVGVIVGTLASTQKREHLHLMTLSIFMIRILK